MRSFKTRFVYFGSTCLVIALGLASRRYGDVLPAFLAEYSGDALWALMVFLGLGILFPSAPLPSRGTWALAFSFAIELSQLYQAPWINELRENKFGALVLGFRFLWTDLVCYTVGVAFGVLIELAVVRVAGSKSSS